MTNKNTVTSRDTAVALYDQLCTLRERSLNPDEVLSWGICFYVPNMPDLHNLLYDLFTKWPSWSGSTLFPVPCEGMDPGNAYRGSRYRWGDHEYGRKRRELLDFCIAELRKRLVTQS